MPTLLQQKPEQKPEKVLTHSASYTFSRTVPWDHHFEGIFKKSLHLKYLCYMLQIHCAWRWCNKVCLKTNRMVVSVLVFVLQVFKVDTNFQGKILSAEICSVQKIIFLEDMCVQNQHKMIALIALNNHNHSIHRINQRYCQALLRLGLGPGARHL